MSLADSPFTVRWSPVDNQFHLVIGDVADARCLGYIYLASDSLARTISGFGGNHSLALAHTDNRSVAADRNDRRV